MVGGPPQFLRITAAQCARDALAGFDRGAAMVFPGWAYRIAMAMLPLLPHHMPGKPGCPAPAASSSGPCSAYSYHDDGTKNG